MNEKYSDFKRKASSALRGLARECPAFSDAEMLVGGAETAVSLKRNKIQKNIDTDWIDKIEATLPYLDTIIRNPSVNIEDVDEILPVELSKHITEKSVKHLAQHTNLILSVDGDNITPSKLLNVFHDETLLTYENKFVNTLLVRLSAFVDKRYRALQGSSGTERNYRFDYKTEFEHFTSDDGGRNSARIHLQIELTSPLSGEMSEPDIEINDRYREALLRIQRLNMTLAGYGASAFVQGMGKNYIRPPVIRTNAILKNKNMKECLTLWEYIESYDRVGYSFLGDEHTEMPSDHYVGDLYSSVALQYVSFYDGVVGNGAENRLLSEKHLFETLPEFDNDLAEEELEDYLVYDSEYKKTVPVSRLMNNRKKLSDDEHRVRRAIIVALRADEILNAALLAEEAERRRAEREARRLAAEEEARRLAAEEEAAQSAMETEPVAVRYRRSFLARYIQAEPYLQEYYGELKNALLSYKGIRARTSWAKETYKRGRTPVAKIDVKGKILYLYLALDPAEFANSKYRFTDAGGDYPLRLRIKGERGKKHALELIALLADRLSLTRTECEPVDYRLPYEEDEALIERGLIKIMLPPGVTSAGDMQTVKADLNEFLAGVTKKNADSVEMPAEEVAPVPIPGTGAEEPRVPEEPAADVAYPADDEEALAADIVTPDDYAALLAETQAAIAGDALLERELAAILPSDPAGKRIVVLSAFRPPLVRRKQYAEAEERSVFADHAGTGAAVLIPYTREQYLALPRKKKKSVLTTVRKMIRYQTTRRLLEALRASDSRDPRMPERIRALEERLSREQRCLPVAQLWEESVKRVKR